MEALTISGKTYSYRSSFLTRILTTQNNKMSLTLHTSRGLLQSTKKLEDLWEAFWKKLTTEIQKNKKAIWGCLMTEKHRGWSNNKRRLLSSLSVSIKTLLTWLPLKMWRILLPMATITRHFKTLTSTRLNSMIKICYCAFWAQLLSSCSKIWYFNSPVWRFSHFCIPKCIGTQFKSM